ncbi:MAG TPA: glycosyltransferase family 4 protein [Candidatus Hydrogenedentes bacterium]|nr:glycosyltransferase family 4 protein [Candidatus Hydrogenedentota bacterium]HPG67279.1 glycosyltransferase family 4 protein [Candidatus Hydrogenedentota bacterium]
MNILYVSTLYPPCIGGAQIQLHCLAKAMQAAGHGVKAITLTSRKRQDWLRLSTVFGEQERNYTYEGVEVTQLGFSPATRARMVPWASAYYGLIGPSVRRLAALTRPYVERHANAPDLVHVTRIGREFIAKASLDFARARGIPFVLTPNHHPRWKGYLYREYDRLYRQADAVLVYTEIERQTLIHDKAVDPARVHVTGVGPVLADTYDVDAFKAKYGIDEPFVLFVGQQYRYKGVEALLNAAPIVWRDAPDVKFVFIGPPTNDTEAMYAGVSDPRIVNLGVVDPETKTSALAACTMLCLPSTQESFGGVFAEAWCYHRPVVGGRIAPIAAVIDEGQDGLLSSQDPDELAAAITRLLGDPNLRTVMGRAGWEKVQRRYTWERLAQRTLDVYKGLFS